MSDRACPDVIQTRQLGDAIALAMAFLAGGGMSVSAIVRCKGHTGIKVLTRSDVAGTIFIYQSVTNPDGAPPVFVRTAFKASVADPDTAEQVIFDDFRVFGEFARVIYMNGVAPQTAFEADVYLLPISGGP